MKKINKQKNYRVASLVVGYLLGSGVVFFAPVHGQDLPVEEASTSIASQAEDTQTWEEALADLSTSMTGEQIQSHWEMIKGYPLARILFLKKAILFHLLPEETLNGYLSQLEEVLLYQQKSIFARHMMEIFQMQNRTKDQLRWKRYYLEWKKQEQQRREQS